jgi:hypothetical protein
MWIKTVNQLPTENLWVEVITPNGDQTQMKRMGNLWFFKDGTYAYFTPTLWKN